MAWKEFEDWRRSCPPLTEREALDLLRQQWVDSDTISRIVTDDLKPPQRRRLSSLLKRVQRPQVSPVWLSYTLKDPAVPIASLPEAATARGPERFDSVSDALKHAREQHKKGRLHIPLIIATDPATGNNEMIWSEDEIMDWLISGPA